MPIFTFKTKCVRPHPWLISVVGILAPIRLRCGWKQEWEAELQYREALLAACERLNWRTMLDLVFRSLRAPLSLSQDGLDERLWGYVASGNYFEVLGVRPAIGRLISPNDDRERAAAPVAVVSYRYWRERLGGDPGIAAR